LFCSQENRTFILEFDKVYRWQALDAEERNQFLFILHKLCKRYLKEGGPEFENFGSITSNSDAAFVRAVPPVGREFPANPRSPPSSCIPTKVGDGCVPLSTGSVQMVGMRCAMVCGQDGAFPCRTFNLRRTLL